MNNLVVFASGSGSNFINIYKNTLNNSIENSRISLLVSNNLFCNSVNFAKENNIESFIINKKRFPENDEYNRVLKNELLKANPALIILAGYMKLIPSSITSFYKNKIVNIHPGKLPDFGGKGFYGLNVHKAVIDRGDKKTTVTIHYVNKEYDKGQIIHEKTIDVLGNDSPESLSKRVLEYEHKVYSKVINEILKEMN